MALLAIIKGVNSGERYSLGNVTVIGRYPFCDITLNETNVSRQHARIVAEDDCFFLEDLNSQNGTFVNGERIQQRRQLKHNDRINIYQVVLRFIEKGKHDSPDDDINDEDDSTYAETVPRGPNIVQSVDATSDSGIISNAEEKWRASLSILRSLGRTLDVDEMLSQLLDDLFGIFSHSDRGYVLLKQDDGTLNLRALKEDGGTNAENTLGPIDRTLAESVIEQGKAVLCLDEESDFSDSVLDLPVRSIMCAPLISPLRKTLGVLYLDTKQDNMRFGTEDLELLVGVSAVAAQSVAFAQQHAESMREQEQHNEVLQQEIDQRKRAEEELKRSNAELQEFAYVASHDLQEPLRAVAGFVQILAQRYESQLDEQAHEFIQYAVRGTVSMKSLIDDLLEYSRVRTSGRPFESTDCNSVFEQALVNLNAGIEESSAEIVNHGLPTIQVDSFQMLQLLQNLIGNSIKYRSNRPLKVDVSAERRGDEWIFAVKDNGIGIAQESFDRVFKVFQRLHPASEFSGSGIGLAICKRICERHGGRIWLASDPGIGSTFFVALPVEPAGACGDMD